MIFDVYASPRFLRFAVLDSSAGTGRNEDANGLIHDRGQSPKTVNTLFNYGIFVIREAATQHDYLWRDALCVFDFSIGWPARSEC